MAVASYRWFAVNGDICRTYHVIKLRSAPITSKI